MVIGDFVTPRRFAEVLSTALGKTISLRETTLEEFNALDRLEPKTPQEVVVYELHTMFRYASRGLSGIFLLICVNQGDVQALSTTQHPLRSGCE